MSYGTPSLATTVYLPSRSEPTPPPVPSPAFIAASTTLTSIPGVLAVHLGEQLEHPGHYTQAVLWASRSALDAFHNSPEFPPLVASLSCVATISVLQTTVVSASSNSSSNIAAALAAPCTEFFLSFGTEDAYFQHRMVPFSSIVAAGNLPGFHALAYGEFEAAAHSGVEPPEGKTVILIVGWDSKEAHLAERGEGKLIDNNVHYIRQGRKSVDMYHVNFTKL